MIFRPETKGWMTKMSEENTNAPAPEVKQEDIFTQRLNKVH